MNHVGPFTALIGGALLLGAVAGTAATPVAKKVIRADEVPAREVLRNPGLDARAGQAFTGWTVWDRGYAIDDAVKRTGPASAKCANQASGEERGISQTVVLDQKEPRPIVASGWSRAQDVSGSSDGGYSIYVDLVYQDQMPLWGQTSSFSVGTHDWEKREVFLVPEKPIKSVTIYGLFRGHTGTVWFDDLSLREAQTPAGCILFDGSVVEKTSGQPKPGFDILVRDVAADSDFYSCGAPEESKRTVKVDELALALTSWVEKTEQGWPRWRIEVADMVGRDRAISVYLVQRVNIAGSPPGSWRWWQNVRDSVPVEPSGTYSHTVSLPAGATGQMSLYPFSCLSGPTEAFSWLLREPVLNRIAFDGRTGEHYVAVDVGISQDLNPARPAAFSADFAQLDPRWGMRAAAQRYYELQPDYFDASRVPAKQGNWMAFTRISSVEKPEDFAFAVHEGNNDVRWDNDHGIAPFVYIEPMSWWQRMPKEAPRTYDEAVREMEEHAAAANDQSNVRAWATKLSGVFTADGKYQLSIEDAPWCDGCVFANNADPDVPEDGQHLNQAHMHMRSLERAMQAAESEGGLAGVYLDSLEGWGFVNNHRREHFKAANLPLTFDRRSKDVVIVNMFSIYEFTQYVRKWVHDQGKLLMANSVPHSFAFLANLIDIMGTETNWLRNGQYAPPSPDYMYIKRVMAWRKPYMFLMNTNYDAFGPEMVERYMQRCIFYGMFPGFFSHNAADNPYFGNPAWYNRDRHLFVRYMPIVTRVAEAGWEAITLATSNDENVWIERFGSDQQKTASITIEGPGDVGNATVTELLSGRQLGRAPQVTVTLAPDEVAVLQVQGA
jgi:hypothetical protein